ncbi:hypothetical protein ACTA71_009589 [Dictyostelium dimigraforme]
MLFNQYIFKYRQGFYGHGEYDTVYPITLIDTLSSQEFIFIVNNLNYKMPYYLSIINSITLFLNLPINIFLFIFHHNSIVQILFLIFLVTSSLFLLVLNIFEFYLPKKRIGTFIEELNNEYSNRLISFHLDQEENIVLLYPYPEHFYKNIPIPFYQQQPPVNDEDKTQQINQELPFKQQQYTSIDFSPIIQTTQFTPTILTQIDQ